MDRGHVSGIERGTFNLTIEILDRPAAAPVVDVGEFLALPDPDAKPPVPLRAGRRKA